MMVARLLVLLALFVAPWFAGEAAAACVPMSSGSRFAHCADEGEAAMWAASHQPTHSGEPTGCSNDKATNIRTVKEDGAWMTKYELPPGCGTPAQGFIWAYADWPTGNTCDKRPPQTGGFTPPNGSLACRLGCEVVYYWNGDGNSTSYSTGPACAKDSCSAGYYWHATLNVCAPVDPPDCEVGQTPKEGVCNKPEQCPEGMHTDENGLCRANENECPAGKTKAPDGSCTSDEGNCPTGQAKGGDGTCKPDADGDGKPDEEDDDPSNDPEKKEFSGGETCSTPPTCSGDPIMCGQARIQWRIECNTRRNVNIQGGGCDAVPVCTGEKCNAMEYAQLLQQWRGSCAMQKLAGTVQNGGINVVGGGGGGPGAGDGNGNGIPDAAEGNVEEGTGPEPSVGEVDAGALWSKVDQAGWLGGGACPGLPTFQFMGRTFALSEAPCEQGAIFAQLTIVISLTMAAFIIGRAAAGG